MHGHMDVKFVMLY